MTRIPSWIRINIESQDLDPYNGQYQYIPFDHEIPVDYANYLVNHKWVHFLRFMLICGFKINYHQLVLGSKISNPIIGAYRVKNKM